GVDFRGPAELKTNDPKALTAWLEGRPLAHSELRPLSLRGDITLAGDRIAADRLEAEFDRKPITGRFAYAFAEGTQPARLEANFKAQDLDIDAALAFGNALLAGADIERPHDMTIAADIGHGTVAGLDARDLSARLKVDAGGLRIDRLSVADLGGAAMSASGHIVTAPKPQGRINLDLDARNMTPVAALLARFWPETAGMIAPRAQAMRPRLRSSSESTAPLARHVLPSPARRTSICCLLVWATSSSAARLRPMTAGNCSPCSVSILLWPQMRAPRSSNLRQAARRMANFMSRVHSRRLLSTRARAARQTRSPASLPPRCRRRSPASSSGRSGTGRASFQRTSTGGSRSPAAS